MEDDSITEAGAKPQPSNEKDDHKDEQMNNANPTVADASQLPQTPRTYPAQPDTPDEEKSIIRDLEAKVNLEGFKIGATWYVIQQRWWKAWKEYVGYEWFQNSELRRPKPGPIENSAIIEPGGEPGKEKVLKNCMENYDYAIISEDMWMTLVHWYGGGPALPRKVINVGWSNLVVEVRPLSLKVCKSSSITEFLEETFSKADTVGYFKEKMCKKMGLNLDDVRVWDYHAFNKYKLLDDMTAKLEASQILDGQPMLLEEKGPDGKFPEIQKNKSSNPYYYYNQGGPTDPGATGLINLGNTCFMNSSLQCLTHTPPLVDYFINDKYKSEVNADNPLGMKGEIAEEYASLMKELWSGTHSAVAPRDLKYKIERFAPQFSGYQQHDSQELLAFLLDGLHEDLNRIRKKPYVENPEVDGRPEEEVANEAWKKHKERNDSIIVDWFQGQLKSTLVCPKCDRVSITFDPFMYLSLPLPMKTSRSIKVTLYFLDPARKPMRFACEVNKFGNVKELKAVLGKMANVEPKSLIITDVYNSRFFKQFMDNESLDAIQDRDVICGYQLLVPENDEAKDLCFFPVISRKEEPINHSFQSMGSYTRKSLFGVPFVLSVSNASKLTYSSLYEMIYNSISRYLKNVPKNKIIRTTDELTGKVVEEEDSENDSMKSKSSDQDELQGEDDSHSSKQEKDGDSDSDDERPTSFKPPAAKKSKKSSPLFNIIPVDSYGMTDQGSLQDNEKTLQLDDKQTLSINWLQDVAEQYYDETAEKDFALHESMNIPEDKETEDSISLDKCIDLFTVAEKLGPEDPWYCSKCKEFQQATKKFDLWKLPPILVVHLKRFSYKNKYWREKLETFVDYPIHDLNLSSLVKGPQEVPPTYELFAVSNHYGSLGGGHYTGFALNKRDKKWYKFDDSMVSKIEESKAKTNSAYVLFYIRKDVMDVNAAPASPVSLPTNSTSSTSSSIPSPSPSSSASSVSSNQPSVNGKRRLGNSGGVSDDDNEKEDAMEQDQPASSMQDEDEEGDSDKMEGSV